MLFIIYCKPEKNQGKKIFAKRLKDSFGIDAIKKYTTREKPKDCDSIDPNLSYSSEHGCQNEDCFIKKYNEEEYFVYSRSGASKRHYYAIRKSDITDCLSSETDKVLICQDIETVIGIRHFGIDFATKIKAYCMIRADDLNQDHNELSAGNLKFLQEIANKINEKSKGNITVEDLKGIVGNRFVDDFDQVDLNFCKNISYFNNLLIVPYCDNFDINYKKHAKKIDLIIEKYMGLQLKKKKTNIFVIHPLTDSVGNKIPQNVKAKFKKFLQVVFYAYLQKGYIMTFAADIQNPKKNQRADFDLVPAIFKAIRESNTIVCDFRYKKPNCFIEYSFAKGLYEKDEDEDEDEDENERRFNICLLYDENQDGKEDIFDIGQANKYYYEKDFFNVNQDAEKFKLIINDVQNKFGLIHIEENILNELWVKFNDEKLEKIEFKENREDNL